MEYEIGFVVPDCPSNVAGRIISALVDRQIPHRVFPVHDDVNVVVPEDRAEETLAVIKEATKKA